MFHTLHKTDMMTFDGVPIKFWTFIGRHNVDEHAKLAKLLYIQVAPIKSSKVVLP